MWVRSGPCRRAARGTLRVYLECVCVVCGALTATTKPQFAIGPQKCVVLGPASLFTQRKNLDAIPPEAAFAATFATFVGPVITDLRAPAEETPCLPFFATRAQIFLEFLSGSDQRPRWNVQRARCAPEPAARRESESESESERARGLDQAVRSLSQHPHHPPRFAVPRPKPSPPSTTLGG